jgi:nucleoside-diphosphate-sugar epimerase
MQSVFIVESTGKVGLRLVKQLSADGHTVQGLYRHDNQIKLLKHCGAIPVKGCLTELSVEQLAAKMDANDVIVFTAGAGGIGMKVTNAVDGAD